MKKFLFLFLFSVTACVTGCTSFKKVGEVNLDGAPNTLAVFKNTDKDILFINKVDDVYVTRNDEGKGRVAGITSQAAPGIAPALAGGAMNVAAASALPGTNVSASSGNQTAASTAIVNAPPPSGSP